MHKNECVGWMGPDSAVSLASGDQDTLIKCLCWLAESWMQNVKSTLAFRKAVPMSDIAASKNGLTAEQRALLAAGCDLRDLLASTPQGRKALLDLGFEPVLQDGKGE